MYFDSHCHLNDPSLLTNLDEVIKRAKDNGVTLMNIIGYDLSSSKRQLKLLINMKEFMLLLGYILMIYTK